MKRKARNRSSGVWSLGCTLVWILPHFAGHRLTEIRDHRTSKRSENTNLAFIQEARAELMWGIRSSLNNTLLGDAGYRKFYAPYPHVLIRYCPQRPRFSVESKSPRTSFPPMFHYTDPVAQAVSSTAIIIPSLMVSARFPDIQTSVIRLRCGPRTMQTSC